eukprot:2359715-Rhodomonas_salina.1
MPVHWQPERAGACSLNLKSKGGQEEAGPEVEGGAAGGESCDAGAPVVRPDRRHALRKRQRVQRRLRPAFHVHFAVFRHTGGPAGVILLGPVIHVIILALLVVQEVVPRGVGPDGAALARHLPNRKRRRRSCAHASRRRHGPPLVGVPGPSGPGGAGAGDGGAGRNAVGLHDDEALHPDPRVVHAHDVGPRHLHRVAAGLCDFEAG